MAPLVSPNSLIGPTGYIDFLANPIETNNDAPLLIDNMCLNVIPTTILPSQFVGGLDNGMATNDKEAPALISRGTNRRSFMQDDNKLKRP
ncbi:hypothetical protein V6N13_088728 [Hibiscus sabdariffa]